MEMDEQNQLVQELFLLQRVAQRIRDPYFASRLCIGVGTFPSTGGQHETLVHFDPIASLSRDRLSPQIEGSLVRICEV